MTDTDFIHIELVFAAESGWWQQHLSLPAAATIAQALERSELYSQHPEAKELAVGIYGVLCSKQTVLQNQDRIEIYRPLVFDPMESRRRRAAHKKAQSKD